MVEAQGFTRRGYLKPSKKHGDGVRAAREKIAADLAHDLSLPIPPAQLVLNRDPQLSAEEAVVVSLVMYPRQFHWDCLMNLQPDLTPSGLALSQAFARASGMLAFDTWLSQTDHADHSSNIIWGYDQTKPGSSEIVFLDFAFSMGFQGSWKGGGWKNLGVAGFPKVLHTHMDNNLLEKTISGIEHLADENIVQIVDRIPETHLGNVEKALLREGLLGRKMLVRGLLKDKLEGK